MEAQRNDGGFILDGAERQPIICPVLQTRGSSRFLMVPRGSSRFLVVPRGSSATERPRSSSGLYLNHFHLFLTETNLEEDDDGTNEHADALEKISNHVDECRAHAGVGLLGPVS